MKKRNLNLLYISLIILFFFFSVVVFYVSTREAPNINSISLWPQAIPALDAICEQNKQINGGYLFICGQSGCAGTYSCSDHTCHADVSGLAWAHACAPLVSNGQSCSGLVNQGAGPWEGISSHINFVGCNYDDINNPKNCFCMQGMSGNATCTTDTKVDWGYGLVYDSCGARYVTPTPTQEVLPCGSPNVCVETGTGAHCESSTNKGFKEVCYSDGHCVTESTNVTYPVECDEKANASLNRCALTDAACPAGYAKVVKSGVCGCTRTVIITTPPVTTPPVTTPPVTTPPVTTPPVTTPPVTTPPVTTPPVTTPPVTTPPVTTPPVTTPPVTTPPCTTPPATTPPVTTVVVTTPPATTPPVTTVVVTTPPATTPPVTTIVVTTPVTTTVEATTPPATTPPGLPKTDTIEADSPMLPWVVGVTSFFGIVKLSHSLGKKYSLFED